MTAARPRLGRGWRWLGGTPSRAVAAGVQKALLEGPRLGEIHPTVVLIFAAVVAEAADEWGGEGLGVQGGHPEPFVSGGLRLELALAVMILGEVSSERTTRTGGG